MKGFYQIQKKSLIQAQTAGFFDNVGTLSLGLIQKSMNTRPTMNCTKKNCQPFLKHIKDFQEKDLNINVSLLQESNKESTQTLRFRDRHNKAFVEVLSPQLKLKKKQAQLLELYHKNQVPKKKGPSSKSKPYSQQELESFQWSAHIAEALADLNQRASSRKSPPRNTAEKVMLDLKLLLQPLENQPEILELTQSPPEIKPSQSSMYDWDENEWAQLAGQLDAGGTLTTKIVPRKDMLQAYQLEPKLIIKQLSENGWFIEQQGKMFGNNIPSISAQKTKDQNILAISKKDDLLQILNKLSPQIILKKAQLILSSQLLSTSNNQRKDFRFAIQSLNLAEKIQDFQILPSAKRINTVESIRQQLLQNPKALNEEDQLLLKDPLWPSYTEEQEKVLEEAKKAYLEVISKKPELQSYLKVQASSSFKT